VLSELLLGGKKKERRKKGKEKETGEEGERNCSNMRRTY